MSNDSDTLSDVQLQSIDNAALTPLVRQVLGNDTGEVTDWRTQQSCDRENRNGQGELNEQR